MREVRNVLAIAILSLTFSLQAFATDTTTSIADGPIELKWMGNIENQPLFSLHFVDSKANEQFKVIIKDESGFEFFNGIISPSKNAKQFLLNTNELSNTTIHFEIISKKSGKKTTYKVQLQQTTTHEMTLTKI